MSEFASEAELERCLGILDRISTDGSAYTRCLTALEEGIDGVSSGSSGIYLELRALFQRKISELA